LLTNYHRPFATLIIWKQNFHFKNIFFKFVQLSSFRRYLASVENWIEMSLVVIVVILVHVPEDSMEDGCNAKRCLAAIAILLSWAGQKSDFWTFTWTFKVSNDAVVCKNTWRANIWMNWVRKAEIYWALITLELIRFNKIVFIRIKFSPDSLTIKLNNVPEKLNSQEYEKVSQYSVTLRNQFDLPLPLINVF